ncbi:MAG: DUF1236 domain-containing protein, partial [Gemmatimonadaceae bacterium]
MAAGAGCGVGALRAGGALGAGGGGAEGVTAGRGRVGDDAERASVATGDVGRGRVGFAAGPPATGRAAGRTAGSAASRSATWIAS